MVMKKYKVRWHENARISLHTICDYIKNESAAAADKIKTAIVKETRSLKMLPERNSRELFMDASLGNFRFSVLWSYKIIYEVSDNEVVILDVFHTSRNPEEIKNIKP